MVSLNVQNLLKESGQTQYWLAKQTGIDSHNIKKICNGTTKSINLSTIDKICTALNCDVSDMFIRKK